LYRPDKWALALKLHPFAFTRSHLIASFNVRLACQAWLGSSVGATFLPCCIQAEF
jgi:hypothetical protein